MSAESISGFQDESRCEPQLQALGTLSELKVLGEIIQVSVRAQVVYVRKF